MKISKWGLVLGFAALVGVGPAVAGDFEGEVDMNITTHSGKTMNMQYFVKGSKMKTHVDSQDEKFSGGGIYDLKTHEYIMVMDTQKMYMVSQLHPEKFTGQKDHHFTIHKTGKSENILGYNCQEWDFTSDDESGKIWFAKGIGNWWGTSMMAQYDKLPPSQKAMVNMVQSEKMFPMKVQNNNPSGNVTNTMEVTRVEKKSLSSSLFEIPAGYKKMDMPSFGGDSSGTKPSKEDIMKMMQQYKH